MVIPFPAYYRTPGVYSVIGFAGKAGEAGGAGASPSLPGFFDIYFDVYFG